MNLNLNLNLNLYVHHFAASVLPHVGLAHGLLDSPWKKLVYGKTLFSDTVTPALSTDIISQEQLTGQLLQLLESQKE